MKKQISWRRQKLKYTKDQSIQNDIRILENDVHYNSDTDDYSVHMSYLTPSTVEMLIGMGVGYTSKIIYPELGNIQLYFGFLNKLQLDNAINRLKSMEV